MRCYKCNSVLNDSDYCLKCGADVSIYKVVVKASNAYYNAGLAKAQVRDLSGAIPALRTSIDINKNNIKARNLLGLVYYEMGEIALAISEWVISSNLKPDKNAAVVYLKKINSNPNKLEQLNQATQKYNFALERAKEDGDDVALIQLKKVIASNPNYVKAYLLLSLIYLKRKENDRALKLLKKVLKIDRNNTLALRYMDEINKTGIASSSRSEDDENDNDKRRTFTRELSGNDVILPRNSYKEPSNGILTVIYIIIGLVIGAAITWFLVVPSKLQTAQHDNNQALNKYSEQLSTYSVQITELENKNSDLVSQLNAAKEELSIYTGASGETALYSKLIEAASAYLNNNFDQAAELLGQIDVSQLPTDTAKALYTIMADNSSGGARTFYLTGVNAYNQKNYVEAISYLLKAYSSDDTTVETPYYLAMSYYGINDLENAQKYVDIVNKKFKNTSYADQLNEYVSNLNQ